MKDSSIEEAGQPVIDPKVLKQMQVLCDFMQMLRAW